MPRRVFYSFHYKNDSQRAARIRAMGLIEGNRPATGNDWEAISRGGSPAIQKWIDRQLFGKSCTVVLIGSQTADRRWINYEIKQSWNERKGLFGIYIHGMKDLRGMTTPRGENPFNNFVVDGTPLSSIVQTYDPPFLYSSSDIYSYIRRNFVAWVEEAITTRMLY